ncbi:hypothetical protein NKH77_35705 [Streptomyces sp. M19]
MLGLWLAVAVAAVALAVTSGGKTNDTFTIPGPSRSARRTC